MIMASFRSPIHILYSIFYDNASNTTTVRCYYCMSYIDHKNLNEYLDNNRSDDIEIHAFPNSINYPINIRLYYI